MDAEAIEKIIKEEAFISLISDDYIQDEETFYYRTIASRFIDNRVLHELVESSPIIASYDRFPRLEEIQKEALILESKPCFSSTFVRFLVAALQPGIRPYVKSINKEINESGISVLNSILNELEFSKRLCRNFLKGISKKRKLFKHLEINGRARS